MCKEIHTKTKGVKTPLIEQVDSAQVEEVVEIPKTKIKTKT